jgi:hypothetical protein
MLLTGGGIVFVHRNCVHVPGQSLVTIVGKQGLSWYDADIIS